MFPHELTCLAAVTSEGLESACARRKQIRDGCSRLSEAFQLLSRWFRLAHSGSGAQSLQLPS